MSNIDLNKIVVKEINVKSVMTKSSIPLGGYCVNPYIGCLHSCKYCYASFMRRFTNHKEEWGEFLDVKYWEPIKNKEKYKNQRIVIGTVTDPYLQLEEKYKRTRAFLEEIKGLDSEILICTKSNLVLRDLDLIKTFPKITVSFSINTLDESFRSDMDKGSSIKERIEALKILNKEGIRTVCFVSPVFPILTDIKAIFNEVKDYCDLIWFENLNLRGSFKGTIMSYIEEKYPTLIPLYQQIYNKNDRTYFKELEQELIELAKNNDCILLDNESHFNKAKKGHPLIVNYFYHEEVRGTNNTGERNKK